MISIDKYVIPLMVTVFLLAACSNQPENPLNIQEDIHSEDITQEPLARGSFFTGRDSFGVAFKAKVTDAHFEADTLPGGIVEAEIEGTGNATHLGRIQVEQDLTFYTGRDSIFGTFVLSGVQGRQVLSGTYNAVSASNGSMDNSGLFDLNGAAQILKGTISATKADNDSGWAALSGSVDFNANTVSYQMDGWLLHFVK